MNTNPIQHSWSCPIPELKHHGTNIYYGDLAYCILWAKQLMLRELRDAKILKTIDGDTPDILHVKKKSGIQKIQFV